MVINKITPSFTGGYKVSPKHIDKVMESFDSYSTRDLFKFERLIRKQQTNPQALRLEPTGGWGQKNLVGEFNVNINGKDYNSANPNNLKNYFGKVNFFKRIGKIADKLNPKRPDKTARKIDNLQDKVDLMSMERARKRGLVQEDEQRNYLLDSIRKMILQK